MADLYGYITKNNTDPLYYKDPSNVKEYAIDIKGAYKDYDDYLNAFDAYKSNINHDNNELNAVRHIGMNMLLTGKYGNDFVSKLGTGYEAMPQITSLSEPGDTKIDLYNNYIGREDGQKYDNLTPEKAITLADYLVKHTSKPAISPNDERA